LGRFFFGLPYISAMIWVVSDASRIENWGLRPNLPLQGLGPVLVSAADHLGDDLVGIRRIEE
jgi:hypothetical protein